MYRKLPQLVDVRSKVRRNGSFKQRNWSQITGISRHHSATTSGDAFAFANYHVGTLGWPSCGYHFVITRDGTIQWANSINRVSYHTGRHNTPLIGICVVGNGSFTQAQERSFFDLVVALRATEGINVSIANIKGHREYSGHSTNACPGINMNTVRNAVSSGRPVGVSGGSSAPTSSTGAPRYPGNTSFAEYHKQWWDKRNDAELKRIQTDLKTLGFYKDDIDGDFGQNTLNAVRNFQDKYDLSSNGSTFYGVPGTQTVNKMNELLKEKKEKPANPYKEHLVMITADTLNYRSSASWEDSAIAGSVSEGEIFTVVNKVKVPGSNGEMYQLKSGVFITASPEYTEPIVTMSSPAQKQPAGDNIPEANSKKYRLRTGTFNSAEQLDNGIKRLEKEFNWVLYERAESLTFNPQYRIYTGTFSTKERAEAEAQKIRDLTNWTVYTIEA